MKSSLFAGSLRSLLFTTLLLGVHPADSFAVGWQWAAPRGGTGRERLTITLDNATQQAQTRRTGEQSLGIRLTPSGGQLAQSGGSPQAGSLVAGARLENGELVIALNSPAFGFITTRPAPDRLVLEIFPDPLGARWKPNGVLAPAPVTPPPAAAMVPPQNTNAAAPSPAPEGATTPQAQGAQGQPAPVSPAPPSSGNAGQTPPPAVVSATNPAPSPAPATPQTAPASPAASAGPSSTQGAAQGQSTPASPAGQGAASTPTSPAAQPAAVPSGSATTTQTPTPANPAGAPPAPQASSPASPSAPTAQSAPADQTTATQASGQLRDIEPATAQPQGGQAGNTIIINNNAAPQPGGVTSQAGAPQAGASPATAGQQSGASSAAGSQGGADPAATPASVNSSGATSTVVPVTEKTPTVPTFRSRLNTGGPENWQENNQPASASTQTGNVTSPAPQTPATPQAAPGAPAPQNTDAKAAASSQTGSPQTSSSGQANASGQTSPPTPTNSAAQSTTNSAAAPAASSTATATTEQPAPQKAGAETTNAAGKTPEAAHPSPEKGKTTGGKGGEADNTPAKPQELSAPLNPTGPADPEVPVKPEGKKGAGDEKKETDAQKGAETADQQTELQPIYVDENGNPVGPPPDVPALLKTMRDQMRNGKYADALPTLETLKGVDLTHDEREEVLYDLMTAKYEANRAKLAGHEQELLNAANEAMNFNLNSPRVPDALTLLAAINLATGNVEDAKGYVYLMRRRHPTSANVAAAFLDLGQKQMETQEYADATISFQIILQEYPESKVAKDAARLQTYSLYKQGHRQRAMTLIDFVDRRWPRIYLEDPDYLALAADIETGEGRLDDALKTYWTQYNLNPLKPDAPTTLQRIAELYYRQDQPEAASKVLEELVRAFPKSEEAPAALLRLGENGVHAGNPTVDELFAIFEAPNPRLPGIFYQRIIQEYPKSPEVVPAKLRTIAWQLWNKEYLPAMNAARSFMIDYEDKPESLRAQDILLRGFARELGAALSEENYERALSLWERFPQVHDYYQPLEPDLRVALARAQLNRGKEAEGMQLLEPFLEGPEDPKYGLYTYNLYLASYLRTQNWGGILSLGEKVASWGLPEEARNQLDYAMALSAENLELQAKSLPLWQKLGPKTDIPLYQRAYAAYFLARDAERRQDLRNAYQYNLDALGMFTQLQDDNSPYADQERIRETIAALMDVTEIAGRFAESLEWANKYAAFVPQTSPDYSGLRFREARLHRKMGDTARWRAIMQEIIDKEPESVFGKMAASELRTQDVARDLTRFTGQ